MRFWSAAIRFYERVLGWFIFHILLNNRYLPESVFSTSEAAQTIVLESAPYFTGAVPMRRRASLNYRPENSYRKVHFFFWINFARFLWRIRTGSGIFMWTDVVSLSTSGTSVRYKSTSCLKRARNKKYRDMRPMKPFPSINLRQKSRIKQSVRSL